MDRMEYLADKARNLTDQPGVYLMKDKDGRIIYIGKAKALTKRVSSYFRKNAAHNDKVRKMVSLVADFDFIVTESEFEALVLECSLIKQHTPKYNILLKDDKGYHYIHISDEPYPRIRWVKQKEEKGEYIGPYTSSFAVRQAVEEANRVFLLPTCRKKLSYRARIGRPCLNYHIGRCDGVCSGKVSEKDYRKRVEEAIAFIKTGSQTSVEQMKQKMEEASAQMRFEEALVLRNRIRAIEKVGESQNIYLQEEKNIDVIAMVQSGTESCFAVLKFRAGHLIDKADHTFKDTYDSLELRNDFIARFYSSCNDFPKLIYIDDERVDLTLLEEYCTSLAGFHVQLRVPQRGEGKRLLQMAVDNATAILSNRIRKGEREIKALHELASLLGMAVPPNYIEAYDISNLGDSGIVGGMVVFENGRPCKRFYKRFTIQTTNGQDDYSAMKEMLTRRFLRYEQEKGKEGFGRLPDLILLDGGSGHLSMTLALLSSFHLQIPCFGMVKDSRHRTRAITAREEEISISAHKAAFSLVTSIQDEVHRYTISFQKNVRKKTMLEMNLTKVKGIGEKRALLILKRYKTKKAILEADEEALARECRITKEQAHLIHQALS